MAQQLDLFTDTAPSTPAASPPQTLAELLAFYQDAASDHPRRVKFRSAINMGGKVLRLPLELAPATPQKLRPLLAKANPAIAGVKPSNWKTIKSTLGAAAAEAGADVMRSRSSSALAPKWQAVMDKVVDRGLQIGLSRPARYFSEKGVAPDKVTAEAFEDFRLALTERSLLPDAEKVHRQCLRLWNKAVSTVPGWPSARMAPASDPRRFSFEWHEFPAALVQDVNAFISAKANTNPLSDDYTRPTRKATADGRRRNLRILASALVLSGEMGLGDVTSLEVLTRPENVKAALGYLLEVRAKGEVTEGHINHAWLMRTIAKYWVKDLARVEELKEIITKLTDAKRKGQGKGMTAKNRERLLQLAIPDNVDALIGLPERVYRQSRAITEPTNAQAVRVMRAFQVGLLTFVPMRSKNLCELELGAHIIDTGKGSKRTIRIHLPAAITKTYRDYNAPVPRHLYPLYDAWLAKFRRKVSPKPSPYLFPNPRGELRSREALAGKLQDFIKRETGLLINAHLFRHIAAKLYLDWDPSGIEIVRQLLGHKSIKTTLAVYAELQTDPAFARMERALLNVGYEVARKERKGGRQ